MFIRIFLKPLSFIPALLLMYMIYNFSAQTGDISSQLSYKVSYKIVETADMVLETNMEDWEIESWSYRIHGFTRKLAHMAEYFALAVAISFPLYVYGVRGIWLMLLAGLICVAFACGDEYHQSFVDGRGPSKRDVAIDSFGAFWGIVLVRIVGWTGRKTIFRPLTRKKKQKPEKKQYCASDHSQEVPNFQQPFPHPQNNPTIYRQSTTESIHSPNDSSYWHQMEQLYGKDTLATQETKVYSQKPYVSQDTRVYPSPMTDPSATDADPNKP